MGEGKVVKELQIKLTKSLQILQKYNWLLNAYVLDFYVDNHWEKLPRTWQKYFDSLKPEYLSELLQNDDSASKHHEVMWPLELLALRQCLKHLCVDRRKNEEQQCLLLQNPLGQYPKLKNLFSKGVKFKKRHEIEQLAAICHHSFLKAPVDFIVDFGAGLGHLARVLGYGYGIRVCCLEMQDELNIQARQIDFQLEVIAAKYLTEALETRKLQRPTHVTLHLTANMQPHEFLHTIAEALQLRPATGFRFGIVGLHPCGDLGAILMRMFLACPQARFLNLVGCCYMKLSTAKEQVEPTCVVGYPLSMFLRQLPQHSHLSYEALEISCHATEVYYDRLSVGNYENLKVHSYRAATERVLVKHWPQLKHCGLRSVKHVPGMQFKDYFYKAVAGLPAAQLQTAELLTTATVGDLQHWQRIVVFYTLRLMLAPLVESTILYDRILYLNENDCQAEINTIFDPRLSPRNQITTAIKRS